MRMDIVRTIRLLLSEESAKMVKQASAPPTHIATVSRVGPDGTAWVRMDGGSGETPATCAVACKVGDRVTVVIEHNRARVTGNVTAPPTDDTRAYSVLNEAVAKAHEFADAAQAAAELTANAAMEVASAIGQHFWFDDSGAHVSTEEDEPEGEQNTLWNSTGMLFRKAANILLAIVTGDNPGVAIYDGTGNAATNILAQFTGALAQVGRSNSSHINIDYHSLQLIDKEGNTYVHLSDLRDASGNATVTETFEGDGTKVTFVVAFHQITSVVEVALDGEPTSAYTKMDNWFTFSQAPSDGTVITITYVTKSNMVKAFTFGSRVANAMLGAFSTVIGSLCEASGLYSLAEGENTVARGEGSHTEGFGSVALGRWSHAQNWQTIADEDAQTVIGKYNTALKKVALIIGGGSSSSRKNILTVDWSGNVNTVGKVNGTGGTMTGTLKVKDNAIDRDSSPSSTLYSDTRALELVDKDGELAGRIRIMKTPAGTMGLQLVAFNEPNGGGTVVYNVFGIQIGRDGTRSYTMSDPAAFRSAIGLARTQEDDITISSNVASGGVRLIRNETAATVIIDNVKLSAVLANKSYVEIGKFTSLKYMPSLRCVAHCYDSHTTAAGIDTSPNGVFLIVMNSGTYGAIRIVNRSGSQLSANTAAWCAAVTYVI